MVGGMISFQNQSKKVFVTQFFGDQTDNCIIDKFHASFHVPDLDFTETYIMHLNLFSPAHKAYIKVKIHLQFSKYNMIQVCQVCQDLP